FAQPTHLGSMSRMIPMAIREYGAENIGPGDALVLNHPYLGGVHLNDIALISPVYHEGELFGYVADIAHHVDVGGGAPASIRGIHVAEGQVDNDGFTDQPVRLVVRVVIDEDGVLFDFTGSYPQRRAPVNSTYSQTLSACAYVLKCLIDPDIPPNEGFYRLCRM